MVRPARLERATYDLEGRCSIRLSYGRVMEELTGFEPAHVFSTPSALAEHPLKPDLSTTPYWHVRYDSNIHLMVLETTALPIKLRTRKRETKRTF